MAKRKGPRAALGIITRPDGVRVEVKNPTTWKALEDQSSTLKLQAQVIDGLKDAIVRIELERDHHRLYARALEGHWWTRFGVLLGLMRIGGLRSVGVQKVGERGPDGPGAAPAPRTVQKPSVVGPSEAVAS